MRMRIVNRYLINIRFTLRSRKLIFAFRMRTASRENLKCTVSLAFGFILPSHRWSMYVHGLSHSGLLGPSLLE